MDVLLLYHMDEVRRVNVQRIHGDAIRRVGSEVSRGHQVCNTYTRESRERESREILPGEPLELTLPLVCILNGLEFLRLHIWLLLREHLFID
jgi:hypothetical protein